MRSTPISSTGRGRPDRHAVRDVAGRRPSYKRLGRTISVSGRRRATVVLDRPRHRVPWDFAFVEAHTVGQDDWTTLPDLNGHTSQDTGSSCPFWLDCIRSSPHYQTGTRTAAATRPAPPVRWWAATGASDGSSSGRSTCRRLRRARRRGVDQLCERRRRPAQRCLRRRRRRVDRRGHDLVRGRRRHVRRLDRPGRARRAAPPNATTGSSGPRPTSPASEGAIAAGSFARQPEIIGFLGEQLRAVPVLDGGRDRRRRRRPGLRAREPDATGLRP